MSESPSAYPALFLVETQVEDDDGVYRTVELPPPAEVTETVNTALDDAGWYPAQTVIDVRAGTREVQDELPPEPPVEAEGVVVVFDQSPAPEAKGFSDGPFKIAKDALAARYDCEIWIDAVSR